MSSSEPGTALELSQLNYVALRHISKQACEMSLINLAISLANTQSEFNPAKKIIHSMEVNLYDTNCTILMIFPEKRQVFWKIAKAPRVFDDMELKGDPDEFEFGGVIVKNRRYQRRNKFVIHSYCPNEINMCQNLVQLMFNLFTVDKFEFYNDIFEKDLDITKILRFPGFNQVEDLTFSVNYPIKDNEFSFFWNNITSKESLVFNSYGYDNQNRMGRINLVHGNLKICNAEWLNEDELFEINCKKIVLKETVFTDKLMNVYIKRWMNGEYRKLQKLTIDIQNGDFDVILDGILSKSMDEIKEERDLEDKNLEFQEDNVSEVFRYKFDANSARQLTRADGRVASIQLKQGTRLYFVVWNAENPKITDKPRNNDAVELE